LAEVGGDQIREVIVVNKADAADPEVLDRVRRSEKHSILVSARTGEGLDELRALIADELPRPDIAVSVLLPYNRGDLVNRLHREAEILSSEHTEYGTRVEANVNQTLVDELAAYAD
jgi:GTP-binding protein HflX